MNIVFVRNRHRRGTRSHQRLDCNFLQVPFYYQEISSLLLRHCPDSFSGREGEITPPIHPPPLTPLHLPSPRL